MYNSKFLFTLFLDLRQNFIKMRALKIFRLIGLHLLIFSFSTCLTSASTYSYSGYKWSGTSVTYQINSTFASSFITAMNSADATWDGAGSKFRFNYGGTTSRNPNVWSYSLDGHNDIGYYNHGSTGKAVAGTISGYSGSKIAETDTTFNTYYSFTTTGASGKYDVQNTMTHEFGHWLELLDVSSTGASTWCGFAAESTMCATSYVNETRKRSLETIDKDAIKAIYGT